MQKDFPRIKCQQLSNCKLLDPLSARRKRVHAQYLAGWPYVGKIAHAWNWKVTAPSKDGEGLYF